MTDFADELRTVLKETDKLPKGANKDALRARMAVNVLAFAKIEISDLQKRVEEVRVRVERVGTSAAAKQEVDNDDFKRLKATLESLEKVKERVSLELKHLSSQEHTVVATTESEDGRVEEPDVR